MQVNSSPPQAQLMGTKMTRHSRLMELTAWWGTVINMVGSHSRIRSCLGQVVTVGSERAGVEWGLKQPVRWGGREAFDLSSIAHPARRSGRIRRAGLGTLVVSWLTPPQPAQVGVEPHLGHSRHRPGATQLPPESQSSGLSQREGSR